MEGVGLLLQQEPRTWVNYDHDVFYINRRTFYGTSDLHHLSDAVNRLSPRDTRQIQNLAVDIRVFAPQPLTLPIELKLRMLLPKLKWFSSLRTFTLVYYDHNSEMACNFPDRHRGELVLADNIDQEDSKWGTQNYLTVLNKFQDFWHWGMNIGWGAEPGVYRKYAFEAEKQKLQNEIDEVNLKNSDLKVPEIRWRYATRKGMYNLGHFEGLGANV